MKKILIAHDFNLNLFMYKLPNILIERTKTILDYNVKFIDIGKLEKVDTLKINIFWGNRINFNQIKKLKNLKWVHLGSSGFNEKILEKLKQKKIVVTNSKGIFDKSVAQTIMAYIFCLSRGLDISINIKNKKRFSRKEFENYSSRLFDITKKKILICGYGSIAKQLILYLKPFNREISILTRNTKVKKPEFIKKKYSLKSIKVALNNNNLIINLLPINQQTKNYFNQKKFNFFQKGTVFVNAGRGDTVNTRDLISAIKQKKIAIYATDVYPSTDYISPYFPIGQKSNLLKSDSVLASPHIANYDLDYWKHQIKLFKYNLNIYVENKKQFKNKL